MSVTSHRREPGKEGFLESTRIGVLSQLISKGNNDGRFQKWSRYFWILRDSLLLEAYKTSHTSSKDVVKTINLNHCENVCVCDFNGRRPFVFKVSVLTKGKKKEYLFNAHSEVERVEWIASMMQLCDLDPDDENYDWVDEHLTHHDRMMMEQKTQSSYWSTQGKEFPPPPPPRPGKDNPKTLASHSSNNIGELTSQLIESHLSHIKPPPVPANNRTRQFGGSSDNISGYGFIKSTLPPSHPSPVMSMYDDVKHDESSSDEDYIGGDNEAVYDDSIFGDVVYPGRGAKSDLSDVVAIIDPAVVKASFSRGSGRGGVSSVDPADRPPLPLPCLTSRSPLLRKKPLPSAIPPPLAAKPGRQPPHQSTSKSTANMSPNGRIPAHGTEAPSSSRSGAQGSPTMRHKPHFFDQISPPSDAGRGKRMMPNSPPYSGQIATSELKKVLNSRLMSSEEQTSELKRSKAPPPEPPPAAAKKKALQPPSLPPLKTVPTSNNSHENIDGHATLDGKRYVNARNQPPLADGGHSKPQGSKPQAEGNMSHYLFDYESVPPLSPAPSFPVLYDCDSNSVRSESVSSSVRSTLSSTSSMDRFAPSTISAEPVIVSQREDPRKATLDGRFLGPRTPPSALKTNHAGRAKLTPQQSSPVLSHSPKTNVKVHTANDPVYVNWPLSEELKRELEMEMETPLPITSPTSSGIGEPPVPSRGNRIKRISSFQNDQSMPIRSVCDGARQKGYAPSTPPDSLSALGGSANKPVRKTGNESSSASTKNLDLSPVQEKPGARNATPTVPPSLSRPPIVPKLNKLDKNLGKAPTSAGNFQGSFKPTESQPLVQRFVTPHETKPHKPSPKPPSHSEQKSSNPSFAAKMAMFNVS